MKFFSKPTGKPTYESVFKNFFESSSSGFIPNVSYDLLVRLVSILRPSRKELKKTVDLRDLISFLEQNPSLCEQFSLYLKLVLKDLKFNSVLSDAAILQDVDFIFELKKRILANFLPFQPEKDSLEFVLNQIFYLPTDGDWISAISIIQLESLFNLLELETIYDPGPTNFALSEVMMSMHVITQRVSGRAMEREVIKMVPEYEQLQSPFSAFEKELFLIEDRIKELKEHFITPDDLSYQQLLVLHKQCLDFVNKAFHNSSKFGISLRVNQNLLKIKQQLERLEFLISLIVVSDVNGTTTNTIRLGIQLIQFNCYKSNIRKFIAESTQLLSYEITQHTAKTGEHYITETRKEYFKMLRTAIGGGFIVGILCLIKIALSKVETSLFGHAFLYSMNYAFGFILIYVLGFTLATKQPAMTASALIKALEDGASKKGKEIEKYTAFSILFARVFRSQFIAFVGNVLMAFPVSLFGIWIIDYYFNYNIAGSKWENLVQDLSPIHSLAMLHAAIAGVFLFLSGIISGSVANRDKHNQVYYRIAENPFLKRNLGIQKTLALSKLYEKRWAGIISNFWFGIFMGSTASFGLFVGLNLDIRHITFASGNLALALYGSNYQVSQTMLFWGIFGIGIIGLINFLVSFSLSLGLAFRSRGMSWFELRHIANSIWRHFKTKPLSFFFPMESKNKTAVIENYLQIDNAKDDSHKKV